LEEIVAAPVKKTENTTGGIRCADHATPSIPNSWYYFAKKRRSLGRHSSLADQSHGVFVVGSSVLEVDPRITGVIRHSRRPTENLFYHPTGIRISMLFFTFGKINLFFSYLLFASSLIPTVFIILGWGYQPEHLQASIFCFSKSVGARCVSTRP
jgi:hypothetical protein